MRGKLDYLLEQKLRYNGGLIAYINNSCHHINIPNPDITMYTDAILTGWGITDLIFPSRGLWPKPELERINVLELRATEIGIYTYCKSKDFLHVRVIYMCDIVTAI